MTDPDLVDRYNYDEFTPEKFIPWMKFDASPPLGEGAPVFPIWNGKQDKTYLQRWSSAKCTYRRDPEGMAGE